MGITVLLHGISLFFPYDINFNSQILCCEDTASSFYHSEWTFKLSASCLIMDKSYITVPHPGGTTERFFSAGGG